MRTLSHPLFLLPLLFSVLLIFPNGGAAASRKPPLSGAYEPIQDPEDAHIQALAKYAVRQHKKESGESLVLNRVLGGQQQVVAGMNYRLVIGAAGWSGVEELYLAVVYEKPWKTFRNLTVFEPIV
ncbi:unnamed protein product [Spirodela intermedia]|uniref:Cystatin domain-containing protein n=1 Tax=Spirodela intermedia TaxID=51605 RepID=A0A7I8KQF5_SPIIN|nr:unnamed protein product [Spirodela intermedia]